MNHIRNASLVNVAKIFETRASVFCLVTLVVLTNSTFAKGPLQLSSYLEQSEAERIDSIDRAKRSAVSVFVPGGGGGGSGVLISPDGYALTNFHVTSPAGNYMRCGLSDGKIYDAVIVGIDPVGDLAMIQLLGRNDFPFAEMADSQKAKPGDWNMVIGNPFLLASNLQPTVSWGILSGVGRYQYPSGTLLEYGDCLQTDASVNPGNSGGPIYNAEGKLLGVIGRCSFEKRGRVNVGVGYAISINQAKHFMGYLRSGRIVDHATLGATVASDSEGGVRVSNILESSDAYRRGLRYQAEILEIDGRVVTTANEVQNVLATYPANWRINIVFRSEGRTYSNPVRLMSVHRQDELLKKMAGAMPPPPPRKVVPPEQEDEDPAEEDKEGKKDSQSPKKEDGHGHGVPAGGKKRDIPEEVLALYEERRGFANYHFNVLEQERFIDSLRNQFPGVAEKANPAWKLTGKSESGDDVIISLGSKAKSMTVGDQTIQPSNKADLYECVDRSSFAGVIPALDAWRRMRIEGPQRFGETIYIGTMPLAGERPLRHCTLGVDGEIEVRWLIHPESGHVEVIEVQADRDEDPAELWVYREQGDDLARPSRLVLRYGTETVFHMNVETWQSIADTEIPSEDAPEKANAEDS